MQDPWFHQGPQTLCVTPVTPPHVTHSFVESFFLPIFGGILGYATFPLTNFWVVRGLTGWFLLLRFSNDVVVVGDGDDLVMVDVDVDEDDNDVDVDEVVVDDVDDFLQESDNLMAHSQLLLLVVIH